MEHYAPVWNRVPMTQETESIDARLTRILNAFGARLGILLRSYHLDRQGIDPADVEQEVRIRLWKAIERDRSGAFHASYVQRVVASTVIDALRRAQVRAAEPLPDEEDSAAAIIEEGVGPERAETTRLSQIYGRHTGTTVARHTPRPGQPTRRWVRNAGVERPRRSTRSARGRS